MSSTGLLEALGPLFPGSVLWACWETYRVSLSCAGAWLALSAWSGWRRPPPPRGRANLVRPGPRVALVLLGMWGIEATIRDFELYDAFAETQVSWDFVLFERWAEFFFSLLSLAAIAGTLVVAHRLRRGRRFEVPIGAAVSIAVVVFTVLLDWLFGLAVLTWMR